jgi:ribosomal protein L11 methylase PrmA
MANAAANGAGDRVEASTRSLAAVVEEVAAGETPPFDLVLANLLAPTIAELGPDLVTATAPTGRLILSGLLADRWRRSLDHVPGTEVVEVTEAAGWVAVLLRHR